MLSWHLEAQSKLFYSFEKNLYYDELSLHLINWTLWIRVVHSSLKFSMVAIDFPGIIRCYVLADNGCYCIRFCRPQLGLSCVPFSDKCGSMVQWLGCLTTVGDRMVLSHQLCCQVRPWTSCSYTMPLSRSIRWEVNRRTVLHTGSVSMVLQLCLAPSWVP